MAKGGKVLLIDNDGGQLEVEAEFLEDLPSLHEQYSGAVDSNVSCGVGMSSADADTALRYCKEKNRGHICLFEPSMRKVVEDISKAEAPHGGEVNLADDLKSLEQEFHQLAHQQNKQKNQEDANNANKAHLEQVKAKMVQILQSIRAKSQELEQIQQLNPDLYKDIVATVQSMITMAKELYPEEIHKHESLTKNALGAALAAILSASPAIAENPKPHPAHEMALRVGIDKWTPKGLPPEMHKIAEIESSNGKKMLHTPQKGGAWNTAFGGLGLKPNTAHDRFRHSPRMQEEFPGLLNDQEAFMHKLFTDHHFYNRLASRHWNYLNKLFDNDKAKVAYAWYAGEGNAAKATPEKISTHPYVMKYLGVKKTEESKTELSPDEAPKETKRLVKDLIPGGKADNASNQEFDQEQLIMGIQHEMEHTDDVRIAIEIAKDHLKENPKYYTDLQTIEKAEKPKFDNIHDLMAHYKEKKQKKDARINEIANSTFASAWKKDNGNGSVIARDPHNPQQWRVTAIQPDGSPSGHTVHQSYAEALSQLGDEIFKDPHKVYAKKEELDKANLPIPEMAHHHNLKLPAGTMKEPASDASSDAGRMKVQLPDGTTTWRHMRSGIVMAPDGTPASSRNPNPKSGQDES